MRPDLRKVCKKNPIGNIINSTQEFVLQGFPHGYYGNACASPTSDLSEVTCASSDSTETEMNKPCAQHRTSSLFRYQKSTPRLVMSCPMCVLGTELWLSARPAHGSCLSNLSICENSGKLTDQFITSTDVS